MNWHMEVHSRRRQGKADGEGEHSFPSLRLRTFLSSRAKQGLLISGFLCSHLDSVHSF